MNTFSAQNRDFNDHRSSPQPDGTNMFNMLSLDDIPTFIPRSQRERTTNALTPQRNPIDSSSSITQDIIQSDVPVSTQEVTVLPNPPDHHFDFDFVEFRRDIEDFWYLIANYNCSMFRIEGVLRSKQRKFGYALMKYVGKPLMLLLEEKEDSVIANRFIEIIDIPTDWFNSDEFEINAPSEDDIEVIRESLGLGSDDDSIRQVKRHHYDTVYKPLRIYMNAFCDKATEIKYKYLDSFVPFFKKV